MTFVHGETALADPEPEPEPEVVDVYTRECNADDVDVCGCIFNGERIDKRNCIVRPGYQLVELSQYPEVPEIPEPEPEVVDVCACECNPEKKMFGDAFTMEC